MSSMFPLSLTLSCKLINPEPVGPEDTLWDRIKSRGDDLKEFATRLSSEKKVLEPFPVPLASAHVQVVVEILPDSKLVLLSCTSLIRALFLSSLTNLPTVDDPVPPNWQSEKERSNESLLPSEGVMPFFQKTENHLLTLKQIIYIYFLALCKRSMAVPTGIQIPTTWVCFHSPCCTVIYPQIGFS